MRVYVVGAGAVGTYLGEALRATGAEVTYAPRRLGDVVRTDFDLALVTVKAYDTQAAVATLQAAMGEEAGATILTPQNGVGNEELLAAAFGADRIVAGALTVPVARGTDGRGVPANRGGLALAPVGTVSHNWLVAAFERTEVPVRVTSDYRALKWSKLALNIVANASCAILDVLPERLLRFDHLFSLEMRALRETHAVMAALGLSAVNLPRYPVRTLYRVARLPVPLSRLVLERQIGGARGRKAPSLLLDLRGGGGRTEIQFLNGAVAAAGRESGTPTPVNAVFARLVGDVSHIPQLWAKYRERPLALLAEVQAEERRAGASAALS
jgi:2-dehydropantoate 2-reductase